MLHKFSAWTHLSNFDQSEHKNLDVERDQRVTLVRKVKSNWHVFPACKNWLNFSFRGQFKIKILIVRHINTTYFTRILKKWTWACDHLKTSNLSADNFKKYLTSMGRHLSRRYSQVILVSGYPVLTAVNWSKHWCPICVHYQFSCAPKLVKSMRLNIVRDLVKQLTGQRTASK